MDLLVEKLDGSRYYLSQYKVLITDFEESAPSVTRNNMQLDQRNGNIDFGGWHKDKTINITGYYRADDMDEEEALREKLYALLSDPDGYYITQLKTMHETTIERPGETSGSYYDKLKDYPSHKRFLVYTEAPEMELVGNVNGTLLYKLTAEFKTLNLPYGETPARDVAINDNMQAGGGTNLAIGTSSEDQSAGDANQTTGWNLITIATFDNPQAGKQYTISVNTKNNVGSWKIQIWDGNSPTKRVNPVYSGAFISTHGQKNTATITWPSGRNKYLIVQFVNNNDGGQMVYNSAMLEEGAVAHAWSPNPADPEYNSWYYGLTGNVSIPYSGTVPCNQLEQQFAIELTAKGTASSLSFKIDETEFTYNGGVSSGDVFLFTGFSYTKNGLSIVSKTNKAYFVLQPDKPNRITCNVPGTIKIIGFQNLYA